VEDHAEREADVELDVVAPLARWRRLSYAKPPLHFMDRLHKRTSVGVHGATKPASASALASDEPAAAPEPPIW
jgi:hypothetical protein